MNNCRIVSAIFPGCMSAPTTLAHTPNVQQLKTRLQQLEQMEQDLQRQIASAEASDNVPQPHASATVAPPVKVLPPALPTTYVDELTRTRESQTWSAFGDPDVFPDTLEFENPPGNIGLSGHLQAAPLPRCGGSVIPKPLFPDLMNHFS